MEYIQRLVFPGGPDDRSLIQFAREPKVERRQVMRVRVVSRVVSVVRIAAVLGGLYGAFPYRRRVTRRLFSWRTVKESLRTIPAARPIRRRVTAVAGDCCPTPSALVRLRRTSTTPGSSRHLLHEHSPRT